MTRAGHLWRGAWFRPAPLVDLALCRLLFVGFQLVVHVLPGRRGELALLAERGREAWTPLPIVELLLLPFGGGRPGADAVLLTHTVVATAGVLALVGLFTRASLAAFALGSLYLQGFLYSFGSYHHPEALLLIAIACLACSPAGDALSADAILRRAGVSPKESAFARWPLLLVRWLLVLCYLSAAASKVAGSGLDWTNGYTLQYVTYAKGLELERPFGVWLSRQHGVAIALSWVVLVFETAFVAAVVWPRLRWVFLPLGTAIHLGIYLAIGAPFFQLVALYAAFVPWRRSAVLTPRPAPSARGSGSGTPGSRSPRAPRRPRSRGSGPAPSPPSRVRADG